MVLSGLIVLAFIIYHLAHFTVRVTDPRFALLKADPLNRYDVYSMMVYGFQNYYVSGFYILGLFLLALHLSHGSSSFFQSLGVNNQKLAPRLAVGGRILAWLLFAGYTSIPVAILLGLIKPAQVVMIGSLDPKVPLGRSAKWKSHRDHSRLVSPNNRRKFEIIMVGSGLAGGSASATLGELGYRVKCFCYQDSPRRAHSIAAQGGINAAKNYQNDGDSVYDCSTTRSKAAIFAPGKRTSTGWPKSARTDHRPMRRAQGVPFAREYGGLLANRSFGGAQVSRTFYARGQTGQQLLLGCYQALCRQMAAGTVANVSQTEMLDVVIVDGQAKGIITRNLSDRKNREMCRRRRGSGHRRLWKRFLSLH